MKSRCWVFNPERGLRFRDMRCISDKHCVAACYDVTRPDAVAVRMQQGRHVVRSVVDVDAFKLTIGSVFERVAKKVQSHLLQKGKQDDHGTCVRQVVIAKQTLSWAMLDSVRGLSQIRIVTAQTEQRFTAPPPLIQCYERDKWANVHSSGEFTLYITSLNWSDFRNWAPRKKHKSGYCWYYWWNGISPSYISRTRCCRTSTHCFQCI